MSASLSAFDAHLEFEQLHILRDSRSHAVVVIAIHDTRLGPAFGGIRRWQYADVGAAVADAQALATAMTWKSAISGLDCGGGKAVLIDRGDLDRRAAYEFLGDFVEQLGGQFFTGPDVSTTDDDLRVVAGRTRFCANPDAEGFRGLADSTARGVFAAARATAAHLATPLEGLRVLVQGAGAVGSRLCAMFAEAGSELSVADLSRSAVEEVVATHRASPVEADQVLATPCDLFVPCALGGVVDAEAARSLPVRAVVGAANNVLADGDAGAILHQRGIPVAPDFVANAGALIHGVTWQLTGSRPPAGRIDQIAEVTRELLERSRAEDVPPDTLALAMARQRLAGAPPRAAGRSR